MNRLENIFALLVTLLLLATVRGHAETDLWSDNFAGNAGSRWTTNSVWQIGVPTYGPAGTHTGSSCATTGLKASAPVYVDARLICTNYNGTNWMLVPAVSQFPRLRFWQWYNFVNSGGYVEIREQTGSTNWQTISGTNESIGGNPASYSSGVWSRPAIDLSAFAGQYVQIAFHFTDGGGGWGSDPGWYIDDVAVVTNLPVFHNPDGFEAGLGDWSVNAGTWEVGQPTSGPATNAAGWRAHSGTNCAATVLAGNYGWNMDTRLASPPFVVPAASSPTFRFWQWYSFVNAGGFVEINNGIVASTAITNSTITTNAVFSSFNTNIYQLSGAAVPGYAMPFYWNSTIGGWTNATKALGNVLDATFGSYLFEAGNEPFASIGGVNVDYRTKSITPIPPTAAPTNFPAWQGMTWISVKGVADSPIGYFGTNYSYTFTTNTTVTMTVNNWQSVPKTSIKGVGGVSVSSGGWTNSAIDLSAYAGQTVQVGFHFQSGPSGWGNAPGWYVDDVSLAAAPVINGPTNLVVLYGQKLTNTISATNIYSPSSTFNFGLVPPSTNGVIKSNSVLIWTNTAAPPGTYAIVVAVTDNSLLLSATNNFTVTVLPLPSQLILTNALSGGRGFRLGVKTPWTNNTWRIEAATNLNTSATNWLPVFTNMPGSGGTLQFTDRLATNYLQRFYRAVYP